MANYTDSLGFNKGTSAYPDATRGAVHKFEVLLDFAAIAAARSAAGAAALAATDTLEVIPVPAGSVVLAAGAQVLTVEGATATMDLGDSGSATRYLSNFDLNAASNSASALAEPYYNSSGLPVRVTLDHNSIDVAKVRVWALVADAAA
jgi:hypothetical protein